MGWLPLKNYFLKMFGKYWVLIISIKITCLLKILNYIDINRNKTNKFENSNDRLKIVHISRYVFITRK